MNAKTKAEKWRIFQRAGFIVSADGRRALECGGRE